MNNESGPLVSVLTPVYNGGSYLAECIESVFAQTYRNWEYTIVNNCSSDDSLAIAQKYAATDSRIRVISNDRCLPVIQNHNHTIRQISPHAKYCKFAFADDWLYPTCIEQMVEAAERNPNVGIVASYGTDGRKVLWTGIGGDASEVAPPYRTDVLAGHLACRKKLLGGPYVFGSGTSLLFRGDLVRKRPVFFNEQHIHGDLEACFDVLQESDFCFIHQILSFSRPPKGSVGTFAKKFDSIALGEFVTLSKYGPVYLSSSEYQIRLDEMIRQYYRMLAKSVLRRRPREFWEYHEGTLAAVGLPLDRSRLRKSVIAHAVGLFCQPWAVITAVRRWWLPSAERNFVESSHAIANTRESNDVKENAGSQSVP